MSLLIFKIKSLLFFEKRGELKCSFFSLFSMDSTVVDFTKVGKKKATHINVRRICISMLIIFNIYILSFESNFLNVIDLNFPVCKEILV